MIKSFCITAPAHDKLTGIRQITCGSDPNMPDISQMIGDWIVKLALLGRFGSATATYAVKPSAVPNVPQRDEN
jgi:hypothetical protein